MSKRFGRNQKRRLKAEVAALSARADKADMDLRHEKYRGRMNEEAVIDTARVLGEHFATLPPTSVAVREIQELLTRYRIPKIPGMPALIGEGSIDPLMITLSILDMEPLLVDELRDKFGEQRLFNVVSGGRRIAAYGLTEEAYESLPRDILARKIGHQLGSFIANRETRQ